MLFSPFALWSGSNYDQLFTCLLRLRFADQMPKNVEMALLNGPQEPHWLVWIVRHVDLDRPWRVILWCFLACLLVTIVSSLH